MINKLIQILRAIEIKNLSYLSVSTLISALIPVIFDPILKKELSVNDFGNYDFFLKLIPILSLIMTFRVETLISSRKAEDSLFIYKSSVSFSTLILFILLLISIILKNQLIILIGISSYLFTLINGLITYLIRINKIKSILYQKPIRRAIEILFTILLLQNNYKFTLIYASVIGLLISFIVTIVIADKNLIFKLFKFNSNNLKFTADYISKNYHLFFGELANTLSLSFLSITVYYFYSTTYLGNLELTFKFFSIPQILITSVIAILIQNKVGTLVSKNESFKKYILYVIYFLIAISTITTLVLYNLSNVIIEALFDERWFISIKYIKILSLHIFFFIIFSPLGRVFYSLEKGKTLLKWQLIKTSIIFISIFYIKNDFEEFLWIYSVLSAISYMSLSYFLFKEINTYEDKIIAK